MDRVFESGAVVLPPTAPVTPSTGYPTGGNPVGGVVATKPGAHWFHMITEELRAIIVAAGLTPDHLTLNQVLQALPAALASRPEMARSLTANGYQKLPGGLILQMGELGINVATTNTVVVGTWTFPIAFPVACLHTWMAQKARVSSSILERLSGEGTPTTTQAQFAISDSDVTGVYTLRTFAIGY